MKTYFERLTESSSEYGYDLIMVACEMLRKANQAKEDSSINFEFYCNSDDEEVKNAFWASVCNYDGLCEGYLKAYNELTNRCVMVHTIDDELRVMAELKENWTFA